MMTIKEIEEAFEQARERLLRGELDEEEFKAEVEKLRYEDELGNQWKIGWYTGKWYRHDQGQWLPGRPLEQQKAQASTETPSAAPPEQAQKRRPVIHWLAIALGILLLIASAVLIAAWNTDWWRGQPEATATQVAAVPDTPMPTATATVVPSPLPADSTAAAPSPTRTQQPTATRRPSATATRRPSATPTVAVAAATSKATATATATVKASATATATTLPVAGPSATVTRLVASPTPALAGRIYFPVYDANPDRRTFDIYAVRLATGEREIVAGQASQLALSPDGKRLAYRSWDPGRRGLTVQELADSRTWLWIGYGEAARPGWSPDSQNIVFPSQQESDRQWRLYYTMGTEFDRVRRHGGDIFGRVPAWLADGRIVYWECPIDKCGLYTMQSDGTSPTRLTTAEHDTAPAGSPDGSLVAFMSNRSGNWEIYTINSRTPEGAQGQGLNRLTQNGARDGLPTWSPDGRWLAFVTDRDGAWAVWLMRPDGSGQRKLFDLRGSLEGEIAGVTAQDQPEWTWEAIAWGP